MAKEFDDEKIDIDEEIEEVRNIIDEIIGTIITVNTSRGKKSFDLAKLFLIDENNLSKEYMEQAASYAFFSVLIADAERNVSKRDLLKDQEYAAADEAYRKILVEKGEKFTEAVVKSQINLDEDYQNAVNAYEDAKYELNILKALVKAYEQKANMLQSLGNHLRSEYSMMGMHVEEKEISNKVKGMKDVISKRRKS